MTEDNLPDLAKIQSVLRESGYSKLNGQLRIGDITVEDMDAWIGPTGMLDLAVIHVRARSRAESSKLYWEIQRLVRALDAVESQRTITVILRGNTETTSPEMRRSEAELQTLARVLTVDPELPVERSLAPLLRLELPPVEQRVLDGVGLVEEEIRAHRRARELLKLLEAAKEGDRSVEASYSAWIDEAFSSRSGAS